MTPQYEQNIEGPSVGLGNRKFNTLSIVSFTLAFLVPLVGLVLGIVATAKIDSKTEKGKGLAISAIVVSCFVFIFQILFVLTLLQFNNVQDRARDSERKADIRLIESKLAEYRADNASYPSELSDMSDIPVDALKGPKRGEVYNYSAMPSGCTTVAVDCSGYGLSTNNMETESNPYTRNSLY